MSPEPEQGTRLSAAEIHRNILAPAERELERSAAALFLSALAAGMVMGFSALAAAFGASVATEHYATVAAAAGYPLGFIFVIMARSELFTENTLVPVVPFLEHRNRETFVKLIRVWALVLGGNLLGALVFSFALARTPVVEPPVASELLRISREVASPGFGRVLYTSVFGGWLIALLAWLLASTRSTAAQILLIWLCTFPIAALGFRHSVAGSIEAFYLAWLGEAGWTAMLGAFVVPAVIGNAIGGVLLVGLLNYSQVAAERED